MDRRMAVIAVVVVVGLMQWGCSSTEWHAVDDGELAKVAVDNEHDQPVTVYADCPWDLGNDEYPIVANCTALEMTDDDRVRLMTRGGGRHTVSPFELEISEEEISTVDGELVVDDATLEGAEVGRVETNTGQTVLAVVGGGLGLLLIAGGL